MCIGILKPDAWKPSSKILNVLVAVQDLLREPVPDDALESGAAEKYKNDRKAYDKEVREATKRWAMK
jgi:ubiquitin-conjugating enzyme E2 D/E